MSEQLLIENFDNGISYLILNRPNVHNAFDSDLMSALIDNLHQLEQNDAVKCIILKANGKSFSAGADLHWMQSMVDYSQEENEQDSLLLAGLMQTLHRCSKPTIACVQGAAIGGGVGLVACCDIAVATKQAYFCLSEVKLGLIPAVISPYVIAAIGERAAKRYFITAERISVEEAHRLGLIHEIVDGDSFDAIIDTLSQAIMGNEPKAMRAAKRLIDNVAKRKIDDDLITASTKVIAKVRVSPEAQARLRKFLKKD